MKQSPLRHVQASAGATFAQSDGWKLPSAFQSPSDELSILKDSVGLLDLTGFGVVRLSRGDRLDFVQRMSTNDVAGLKPGQGAATVFTSPIGRILDLAFVLLRDADLLLVVGRGADEKIGTWLQEHIFFNDDVLVETITRQQSLMGLCGPDAKVLMEQLCGERAADLRNFHIHSAQIKGVQVTVVRSVPLGNDYLLLTDAQRSPALWSILSDAVASAGGAPVGETAFETTRIGAGWPRFGHELNDDYIPLEAGLKWAVSFNKGCYVGQEIIARMESRQRLAKRLVLLGYRPLADAPELGPVFGDEVWLGDAEVGHVTSVAPISDAGVVKMLAYVRTGNAEPGTGFAVGTSDGACKATLLAVVGSGE
jgi:folate-binding protein YgfZ